MSRPPPAAAARLAGLLWDRYGASWTFLAGAAFCVLDLGTMLFRKGNSR